MGGFRATLTFLFPRSRPSGSARATPTAGGQTPFGARNLNRLNRLRLYLTGHPPDARSTIATTIMDEARAPAEKANPSTGTSTTTSNAAPPTTTTITTTTTSSSTTPTPTPTPGSISIAGGSEAQGQGAPPPLRHGHELPFVAPSSYLRPKPAGRDMTTEKKAEKKKAPPLTVLDEEQLQGLVSTIPRHTSTCPSCPVPVSPLAPRPPPPRAPRPRAASCGVPARLPAPSSLSRPGP